MITADDGLQRTDAVREERSDITLAENLIVFSGVCSSFLSGCQSIYNTPHTSFSEYEQPSFSLYKLIYIYFYCICK